MFDDIVKTFETLLPGSVPEIESVAEFVHRRPDGVVGTSVEAISLAITAMLGGAQERTDQVKHIASASDAILSSEVERENATTVREMAAGNQLELGLSDRPNLAIFDEMITPRADEEEPIPGENEEEKIVKLPRKSKTAEPDKSQYAQILELRARIADLHRDAA